MKALRTVALDDEAMALSIIKSMAEDIDFVELKAQFTQPSKALEYLRSEEIDLLFLDIKMPDITGFDFLSLLKKIPLVILTTAYSEHAVKGFEINAVDYLLKPFSRDRFKEACIKAKERFQWLEGRGSHSIFIKSGYEQIKVQISDILYIQSAGNYVQFVLENDKVLSRMSMQEVVELLEPYNFSRVHRSYIVSNEKIDRKERTAAWIGTHRIPLAT